MNHLAILVEEQSMKAFLDVFLKTLLDESWTFEVRDFSGKHRLLRSAHKAIRGHRSRGDVIMVLVDQDRQDCVELKGQLNVAAGQAGARIASASTGERGDFLARIVVRELEAWWLCDPDFTTVFPRVPAAFRDRQRYRHPETIEECWEATQALVAETKHEFTKVRCAEDMALVLSDRREHTGNDSASFHAFLRGVAHLTSQRERA